MKKGVYIIIGLFISAIVFNSCAEESEFTQYWYSFATFVDDDNVTAGYSFNLDSGGKLIPTNNGSVSEYEDSSRVVVTYSVASDTGFAEGRVIKGSIATIKPILTKDVIQLTDGITDSIGSDQVFTNENDIWMTEKHLNIIFRYYGSGNILHYINLTKPIGEQKDEDGNQILEFRHNTNDDVDINIYESVVSFSMDSLYEQGMDSLNFVLVAVKDDTINFKYYDTFYFDNATTQKMAPNGREFDAANIFE